MGLLVKSVNQDYNCKKLKYIIFLFTVHSFINHSLLSKQLSTFVTIISNKWSPYVHQNLIKEMLEEYLQSQVNPNNMGCQINLHQSSTVLVWHSEKSNMWFSSTPETKELKMINHWNTNQLKTCTVPGSIPSLLSINNICRQ